MDNYLEIGVDCGFVELYKKNNEIKMSINFCVQSLNFNYWQIRSLYRGSFVPARTHLFHPISIRFVQNRTQHNISSCYIYMYVHIKYIAWREIQQQQFNSPNLVFNSAQKKKFHFSIFIIPYCIIFLMLVFCFPLLLCYTCYKWISTLIMLFEKKGHKKTLAEYEVWNRLNV
jgi:hypothetical protein